MRNNRIYINFPIEMVPPLYMDENTCKTLADMCKYGAAVYAEAKGVDIKAALQDLGLNPDLSEEEIKEVFSRYKDSRIFTSIDRDRLKDFLSDRKSYAKNADEIMTLCGLLALRSIIGTKDYALCHKGLILSRMAGQAKDVTENDLPPAIKRLAGKGGERQWRKLLASLKASGMAIYNPVGCRGLFASFRLSPVELAEKVERKKRERKPKTEYEMTGTELQKIVLGKIRRSP